MTKNYPHDYAKSQFSDVVHHYEVMQYEAEGLLSRLKMVVFLTDGSQLDVRETVLNGQWRKYAYHWQDTIGQLRVRWDNAAHWPAIETHPHHKHIGDKDRVAACQYSSIISLAVSALLKAGGAGIITWCGSGPSSSKA